MKPVNEHVFRETLIKNRYTFRTYRKIPRRNMQALKLYELKNEQRQIDELLGKELW